MTNDTPPHSIESEQQVLGCILLEAEMADVAATKIKPGSFYDLKHQAIYDMMMGMRGRHIPIDAITVSQELRKEEGGLERIGGTAYLSQLANSIPTTAHFDYHAGIVRKKKVLRDYLKAGSEIARESRGEGDDDTKMEKVASLISSVVNTAELPGREMSSREIVAEALTQIEVSYKGRGKCSGVPTGFYALDNSTGGMQKGDMIVVAARPSVGKTSLALNIAEHVALVAGRAVGFLSLEMTATALMKRIVGGRAGVNSHSILSGELTDEDFRKMAMAASTAALAPLHINDSTAININEVSAICRRMVLRNKCELLIVDYLQLIHAKAESRVQEVSKISSAIKSIAKELKVPVVILSQLNRAVDTQERRPRLSDLRDSGAIEQDADVVILLSRDSSSDKNTCLDIAKHRSGPTGWFELEWNAALTRFSNPSCWVQQSSHTNEPTK